MLELVSNAIDFVVYTIIKMSTKITLSFLLLIITSIAFSQKGIIRGKITDASNGEELPFVNVYVKDNGSIGTTSDFEGNYTLKLEPGTYEIVCSFVSYKDAIKTFNIKAGESYTYNISLSEATELIGEVEIIAEKRAAKSMAAFDREKMKSTNMIDGTSSEQMKKTGDGDAGEVIKRVTGVSVEGGKHVYVRGLGDRYTKTILNSIEIPGLDPDRNTVQMDIFPTNLIDNITVYKTFTPELPGDYTGGLVNILTKDFPAKKTLSFSAGVGYNTIATFNPNFITYNTGKYDFLGFDDGSRSLPINPNKPIPDPALGDEELHTLTKAFSSNMGIKEKMAGPNQSYSFGIGNQLNSDKKDIDYGYNFYVSYQNNYKYYNDVQYNAYRKLKNLSEDQFFLDRSSSGELGIHNVLWSALLGQSIKINKVHKLSLNLFHTQNGESQAAALRESNFESNDATLVKQSLQYTQRSTTNANLSGTHSLADNKWQIKWTVSPSLSMIKDPDIRSTILEEIETDNGLAYGLYQSVGGEVRRIYRDLNEKNLNSKLDFTYSFDLKNDLESNLKFGLSETFKDRSFTVYDYIFDVENISQVPNDPNWFLQDENIWTPETDQGTFVSGQRELANSFDANQMVLAAYIMNELPISQKFKAVYGARVEKVTNKYTGQNNNGTVFFNDSVVLDETNLLPAVNFVYVLKDSAFNTMNLRASYTQTLARPSFKEKSIAQIYDPIQGRRYNGNIDLLQTNIHNADLRWEYFYGRTEVLSASLFYKKFINPIELVSFDVAPNEVQPKNNGEANIYGIELEARKRIGYIDQPQNKFYVGANFSWIVSQIDMNKVKITKGSSTITEKESREAYTLEGEVIGNYRPMSGQSPYLINAFTSFSADSAGLDFNLSYNIQGRRLSIIGIGAVPDVYENPFHSLNLKVSKKLGKNNQWKASFTAQNILNNKRIRYYESYQAIPQIYDYFRDGRTFNASVSYTL